MVRSTESKRSHSPANCRSLLPVSLLSKQPPLTTLSAAPWKSHDLRPPATAPTAKTMTAMMSCSASVFPRQTFITNACNENVCFTQQVCNACITCEYWHTLLAPPHHQQCAGQWPCPLWWQLRCRHLSGWRTAWALLVRIESQLPDRELQMSMARYPLLPASQSVG
jgi:hypothetical protein